MTLHQLTCPNCGASLNIENGIDTFFCTYCGTKLISDGQSDVAIRAKADIILADKAIERERYQQAHNERMVKERNTSSLKILFAYIIAAFLLMLMIRFLI